MSRLNVFDASAILAYLQEEKGHEIMEVALDAGPSWITAVNYCEILSKLREKGMSDTEGQGAVDSLRLSVVDFDAGLAISAARMRLRTRSIGASLGDRACLAFAQRLSQASDTPVVYTAEHSWTKLKWPFKIALIRPPKTAS